MIRQRLFLYAPAVKTMLEHNYNLTRTLLFAYMSIRPIWFSLAMEISILFFEFTRTVTFRTYSLYILFLVS